MVNILDNTNLCNHPNSKWMLRVPRRIAGENTGHRGLSSVCAVAHPYYAGLYQDNKRIAILPF
jgi:hypothetical protein